MMSQMFKMSRISKALTYCSLVAPYRDIDVGHIDGTKPLHETMLTYHFIQILQG